MASEIGLGPCLYPPVWGWTAFKCPYDVIEGDRQREWARVRAYAITKRGKS